MTDPQRYAQTCGSGICMDPADDGEWVRHYAYQTESDKWAIQHSTDSRELRRLCADRDEYKARADRLAEALRVARARAADLAAWLKSGNDVPADLPFVFRERWQKIAEDIRALEAALAQEDRNG